MTRRPLLGLIGDDATGTLSASSQLADSLDLTAQLWIDWEAATPDTDVLAMNTRTRTYPDESEAYTRSRDAAEHLVDAGVSVILKRFDSALRGHIGVEARSVVDVRSRPLLCTGSYFELGRVTAAGAVHQSGVPIIEVDVTPDTVARASTPLLSEVLESAGLEVTTFDRGSMRDKRVFAESIRKAMETSDVVVFDSEEPADTLRACAAVRDIDFDILMSSAGLGIDAMLARMSRQGRGSIVCLVGSSTVHTRAQIEFIAEVDPSITLIEIIDLTAHERRLVIDQILASVASGRDVLVHTGDRAEAPRDYLTMFAEVAGAIGGVNAVRGIVVIGGETANAVMDGLGLCAATTVGKWGVGECLSRAELRSGRSIELLTRSGAVGASDALLRAVWRMSGRGLDEPTKHRVTVGDRSWEGGEMR